MSQHVRGPVAWTCVWLVATLCAAAPLRGQGVVDRTPNLSDGWIARAGTIQFDFLHRFQVSPPPARKVTSFPNFHLGTGLPLDLSLGLDYATNSTVFSGIPNEYQVSLRRAVVRQSRGAPGDAGLTAGYNFASQSLDGELTLVRTVGRLRLLGAVRGISSGYDVQRSVWGVGAGALVRLTDWLSVGGDVFDLVNVDDSAVASPAWGVAAQLRIPYSPHTFSLQVTNTQSASIEGSSRGRRGEAMVGFEFTIPFTLSRYFGGRARGADTNPPPGEPPAPPTGAAIPIEIANYAFGVSELHVRAGTLVRWVNRDQLAHSVTADEGSFDSGLIESGGMYERRFDRPGAFAYHCTPHPFMKGRVIVEGP